MFDNDFIQKFYGSFKTHNGDFFAICWDLNITMQQFYCICFLLGGLFVIREQCGFERDHCFIGENKILLNQALKWHNGEFSSLNKALDKISHTFSTNQKVRLLYADDVYRYVETIPYEAIKNAAKVCCSFRDFCNYFRLEETALRRHMKRYGGWNNIAKNLGVHIKNYHPKCNKQEKEKEQDEEFKQKLKQFIKC